MSNETRVQYQYVNRMMLAHYHCERKDGTKDCFYTCKAKLPARRFRKQIRKIMLSGNRTAEVLLAVYSTERN